MAIYRRSSRRPLVIAAVLAAIAGLVLGFVAGRATAPDLAAQVREIRAQAAPILTSLEVVRTEYPKLLAATPGSDPGGAESALTRARTTLAAVRPQLVVIDPAATADLQSAIDNLSALVTGRASQPDVEAAIDAAEAIARRLAGTSAA